jgi:hypothetical protein
LIKMNNLIGILMGTVMRVMIKNTTI